jgi:hypothetical protein
MAAGHPFGVRWRTAEGDTVVVVARGGGRLLIEDVDTHAIRWVAAETSEGWELA